MSRVMLITGISTGIGKSFIEIGSKIYPNDKLIALTRNKITYEIPDNVSVYYVDITDFNKTNRLLKEL